MRAVARRAGMRRRHALTVLALGACPPLVAQDAPAVFQRLEGAWVGDGTLLGRAARFTMRWQHADGFAVLTFANMFAAPDGSDTPVLNAVAIYRTLPASAEAVWLDSRGVRVEIRWEATDSTLVSHWTAPTEAGRTTYRMVGTDGLEVVDEVRAGDAWREFGRARYRPRR